MDVRSILRQWSPVLSLAVLGGCVDAPITADQLQPDGSLRTLGHAQAAFAADSAAAAKPVVQVSAVLAAQAEGPLQDRNAFPADVGRVHLHLRADGLLAPRAVVYRWSHEEFELMEPGVLAPHDAMTLGASFEIDPDQTGTWEVDVLAQATSPEEAPRILFHREFEVESAHADASGSAVPAASP